jgi:hypothetical protein
VYNENMSEEKAKETTPLKWNTVKGRISTLKKQVYKGCLTYVLFIAPDIFQYLIVMNDQIYMDYFIITPEEGKTELTKKQIAQHGGLCFMAAATTIDEYIKASQEIALNNPIPKSRQTGRTIQ